MWVRGLKHLMLFNRVLPYCVAPYVGAWIETLIIKVIIEHKQVAPYVGAWIETSRLTLQS